MAALLLMVVAGACEAPFEPLTRTETEFFAVYGYLDANADTQFVRVSPLRPALDPASTPEGTQVHSVLMPGDARVAWQDSLVQLDDGTTGLLFFAPMRVLPARRYRLEITANGQDLTTATTLVPPAPPLRPGDVRKTAVGFLQDVTWQGVTRPPARPTLAYLVQLPGEATPDTLIVSYSENGRAGNGGWVYPLDLSGDRAEVLTRLNRNLNDTTLVLLGLHMEIEQRSEEWAREEPVNITNGLGFFGALGRTARTWQLPREDIVDLDFTPPPFAQ